MILEMLATDVVTAARTWRMAEYGGRASKIRDAIVEPLWTGPRVLAFVTDTEASMTDAAGEPVEHREDVLAALVEASQGAALLVEGVLTSQPLQELEQVAARDDLAAPTPSQMATRMIFGDRSARKAQLEARLDDLRRRLPDDTDVEVAFVAVDLRWLDDQSICDVPLLERKRLLESVLQPSRLVRLGTYVRPPIDSWLTAWRLFGFRRMSYRAANSRYVPGARNRDWAQADIPRR